MIINDNESWNIRDRHMVEVIHKIDSFYNHNAKGIIWEHNTHVGDARATDMANFHVQAVYIVYNWHLFSMPPKPHKTSSWIGNISHSSYNIHILQF